MVRPDSFGVCTIQIAFSLSTSTPHHLLDDLSCWYTVESLTISQFSWWSHDDMGFGSILSLFEKGSRQLVVTHVITPVRLSACSGERASKTMEQTHVSNLSVKSGPGETIINRSRSKPGRAESRISGWLLPNLACRNGPICKWSVRSTAFDWCRRKARRKIRARCRSAGCWPLFHY